MTASGGPEPDDVRRGRDAALDLLAVRLRTVDEMRRRLRRKEFGREVVERVVDGLLERGLLDDAEFCRTFLRERLEGRPRGRFALVQELRKRGVARELAEEMVERVMREEGVAEDDGAHRAAEAWLAKQPADAVDRIAGGHDRKTRERLKRRLYGYLERRGFPRGLARRVMEETLERIRSTGGPR